MSGWDVVMNSEKTNSHVKSPTKRAKSSVDDEVHSCVSIID